jgi:Skp family chaperone for outer membrane proteins
MTKLLFSAAAAALFAVPTVAAAQALPAPVIAVVDVQKAMTTCNACKTALGQLETQLKGIKSLQASLEGPLQTEARAIQTAANALGGKPADAALTARAEAFEKKQNDAQRQLQTREQQFQRNRSFVLQQINQKMEPVLTSVLARRNASVMLDAGSVVRFAPTIDVTNDVVAGLNTSLTSISATAPAQTAAAPQGR